MKTKLFFLMALSTLLFLGCSTDTQEDLFNDSVNAELSQDNISAKAATRPFKVKGSGTWQVLPEATACEAGLFQVFIEGKGNATHLGLFDVTITACTNFDDSYFFDATLVAANGDELSAISVDWGYTEEGQEWTDYIFDGGTGRFENATGDLRLYGVSVPTVFHPVAGFPIAGIYNNSGYGTITY